MDVALPEAQVLDDVSLFSSRSLFLFLLSVALSWSFPFIVILHHTFIPFNSPVSRFISPIPSDTWNFLSADCRRLPLTPFFPPVYSM